MPSSILIPPLGGGATAPVPAVTRGIVIWDGAQFTTRAGALISANGAMTLAGSPITANEPIAALTQEWNNAAVTFYGLDVQITNTASAAASRIMRLRVGAAVAFDVNMAGTVSFPGSLNMGSGATNPQANLNGGTATTSLPPLSITQTWNAGAVTFTAIFANITNTASDVLSKLIDLQVGGVTQFNVTRAGVLNLPSAGTIIFGGTTSNDPGIKRFGNQQLQTVAGDGSTAVTLGINQSNSSGIYLYHQGGPQLGSGAAYSFTGGAANGTIDLTVVRDAANTWAQRRGTNAQVHRIYYTYTDASNYQRMAFQAGAAYVEFAAETAGTGADDLDIRLTPAGVGMVDFRNPQNGAGAAAGTLTNAPSAGNPAYWLKVKIGGTVYHIPAWT